MGRYYSGDIEGKFWFAIQNSDDGEQFGAYEDNSHMRYVAHDADAALERLQQIASELAVDIDFGTFDPEKLYTLMPKEIAGSMGYDEMQKHANALKLWASLELGLKIYQCIKRQGWCSFEAEF